jgi:hypothetical protein
MIAGEALVQRERNNQQGRDGGDPEQHARDSSPWAPKRVARGDTPCDKPVKLR